MVSNGFIDLAKKIWREFTARRFAEKTSSVYGATTLNPYFRARAAEVNG